MTDNQENTPTAQQVNDAQHLDNMTSLQQPSAAEQSSITQNGEVTTFFKPKFGNTNLDAGYNYFNNLK